MPHTATASGDLQNALKKLLRELSKIHYSTNVDWIALRKGDPVEYLRLFHYVFLEYSPSLAAIVINVHGMELYGKTDREFIGAIFKLLLDEFNYRALLTRDQFLTDGFAAELKALIAADVISLVHKRFGVEHPKKSVRFGQMPKTVNSPLLDMFPAALSDNSNSNYKENEKSVSVDEEITKLKAENRELRAIVSQCTSICLSFRSTLLSMQNEAVSVKETLQKCCEAIDTLTHKVDRLESMVTSSGHQEIFSYPVQSFSSNSAYQM